MPDFLSYLKSENRIIMRSQSTTMAYCFKQIETTLQILESIEVNAARCQENFEVAGKLVVAELLHLALQKKMAILKPTVL